MSRVPGIDYVATSCDHDIEHKPKDKYTARSVESDPYGNSDDAIVISNPHGRDICECWSESTAIFLVKVLNEYKGKP